MQIRFDSMNRLKSLIIKEFLSVFKDPKNRALIVIPPIMQLFVFAPAITLEIKNIDLAVLDYSASYQSRELVSRFYNSPWFKKIRYEKDLKSFKNDINLKNSHAGIIIQNDFANNISKKETSNIFVVLDGRQTNSAGILSGYISEIISNYNKELQNRYDIKGSDVNLEIRNWYNSNILYEWFLTVNLIVMLSLVLVLLLSAMSIARERELGTFNQLLVSPLTYDEILIGKTIPPLIISVILTLIITLVVIYVFDIPFRGNVFLYVLTIFTSLFSIIGIGLFISSISYTQQMALLGAFSFEMPAVLLSGFVSPIEDMPKFFQIIASFNPIKYYMHTVKGIYFKNMSAPTVIENLVPLFLIAIITLGVARWSFKNQLK